MSFDRREFLKLAGGAAALASSPATALAQEAAGPVPASQSTAPKPAAAKPLKILVLGGTGFIGPAIVKSARARGHALTLFNRGKTNPGMFPDVEKLQGDRDPDKAPGLSALKGRTWDAVVDTWTQTPKHVKASAELLAATVGQYLFVSTISVYLDFKQAGTTEDSLLHQLKDPADESRTAEGYGGRKALCEQLAEKAMPGRVTVARPGLIVGHRDPTDRFPYWPARIQRGGEVLAPGTGQDPVQYIDANDLADWIVGALENRHTGIYNLVGPVHPATFLEYLHGCKACVSSDAKLTWVSEEFLKEQKVSGFSDLPMWLPQSESPGFATISHKKAIATGLRSRPLADSIRDTLAWSAESRPPGYDFPRGFGLGAEREKQLLTAWKSRGK